MEKKKKNTKIPSKMNKVCKGPRSDLYGTLCQFLEKHTFLLDQRISKRIVYGEALQRGKNIFK